jgi:capsular polysaccharide export protein
VLASSAERQMSAPFAWLRFIKPSKHRHGTEVSEHYTKSFLFLQGPHGPFFHRLGKMLRLAGANVYRVGFNAGDRAFWFGAKGYIPYRDGPDEWDATFRAIIAENQITDIVLYGDTRPIHAQAVDAAHWGGMRHHVFYGALYHWFVMFRNGEYRKFQRHRELPLVAETALYTRRLMLMPFIALDRIISTFRIKHGGYPYHIALLQLEHDSSFQMHSPFDRMEDFLALVIEGFAKGAPKHHHLVFKAQP